MTPSVVGPSRQIPCNNVNGSRGMRPGGLPPSTLAAQIVQNHERAAQERKHEQRVTFGLLLQEILSSATSEETDFDVNYKLVRVVTEAGLDVFLQDDPFARRDLLVEQAKDSISVIELTVRRNPALLLFPNRSSSDYSGQKLFIWILPRILALLGNPKADGIHDVLQHLLSHLISSLMRTGALWQNGIQFLDVYKLCVDDLLSALQHLNVSGKVTSLTIDLPPSAVQIASVPTSQQSIALTRIPQCNISRISHAFRLVLALVEVTIGTYQTSKDTVVPRALSRSLREWVIGCCSRLWQTRPQWSLWLGTKEHINFSTEAYFRILRFAVAARDSTREANFLIQAISDLLSPTSPPFQMNKAFQREIAKCIIAIWESSLTMDSVKQFAMDQFIPIFLKFEMSNFLGDELLPELKLVASHWLVKQNRQVNLSTKHPSSNIHTLEDEELQAALSRLELGQLSRLEDRPAKRPRVMQAAPDLVDRYNQLQFDICKMLDKSEEDSRAPSQADIIPRFLDLPEHDQVKLLDSIARLPCTISNFHRDSTKPSISVSNCLYCGSDSLRDGFGDKTRKTSRRTIQDRHSQGDLHRPKEFLAALVTSSKLQRMTKPRIHAMLAIRRFLVHRQLSDHLDLKISGIGQFCLKSLHSSIREIRIVTGFTLPSFLGSAVSEEYRHANRVLVLDYLRQLSSREDVDILETTILAWGQAAQVCGDEELNLALLQFVEFLGHTNPLICGMAFNELLRLSEVSACYPEELLKPFSRSISISVVKDLLIRPQKAQQLADLLRVGVNQYLLTTETETLPYLVLAKRRDILERLAAAHGPETTVQDICMQPRANLVATLSLLLLEPASDVETNVMHALCEVAPGFADYDLSSLLKLDSVLIMCEMLKAAGDANVARKPQVHRAIKQVTALVEAKTTKLAAKQNRAMLGFFEQRVLGIMAHFSDIIEKGRVTHPMVEKRRCLRAIEELMDLSKGRVSIALPQLRACLQSALDNSELRELAFSAWTAMVAAVGEDDVSGLIDHTFAIVAQYWKTFSDKSAQQASNIISFLVKNHESRIRASASTVPTLADIEVFSKVEGEIKRFRSSADFDKQLQAFAARCRDENSIIVSQALKELDPFLETNSQSIHESASSEQPSPVIADLIRSILAACVTFKEDRRDISNAGARCLGIIGCVDFNRVDQVREKRDILILSNFERPSEAIDFVALLLESVLVKAFRSATNARAQGFLAYVMQELLKFCGFHEGLTPKSRNSDDDPSSSRWQKMPSSVRTTLAPFLTSRYLLTTSSAQVPNQSYPIFRPNYTHSTWLRTFASDLLRKGKGDNAKSIFSTLSRVVHGYDIAIPAFLLPFVALNVVLGGTEREAEDIQTELLSILSQPIHANTQSEVETIKQCSENVFQILDYMSRWMQGKKKALAQSQLTAQRLGTAPSEMEIIRDTSRISTVERILSCVPAAVVASRAMDCRSYARAVYHWEIHMRQEHDKGTALGLQYPNATLYERLQEMYAHIDEPDAVEGLSAVLDFVKPEQQLMEHVRSERWDAVQTWYEIQHNNNPDDVYAQIQLSRSLYESGQNDALLDMINRIYIRKESCHPELLAHAVEASWVTSRWQDLEKYLKMAQYSQPKSRGTEFDLCVGEIMSRLHQGDWDRAERTIVSTRETIVKGFSVTESSSIKSSRDQLRSLHVLYEIETLSGLPLSRNTDRKAVREKLDRRLPVLGTFTSDKQALLRLRRKAMGLSRLQFTNLDEASTLTACARIARKAGRNGTAYSAIIRAQSLQDRSALIEHARMLWKDGQHRNAIKMLEGAIELEAFKPPDLDPDTDLVTDAIQQDQNLLAAQAQLLRAKWLDASGQTQSHVIIENYQSAIRSFARWEKGHYYLGKHYNKLLESEKALPPIKQSPAFLSGETAKLVIDNYLRSIPFGNKYVFQTLPRVLHLWLEVASDAQRLSRSTDPTNHDQRQKVLEVIHRQIRKYLERLPAYVFYTALPQLVSRISHPHPEVWKLLQSIITKIVLHHPQQALWSIIAVAKSSDPERSSRGYNILNNLKSSSKKGKGGKDVLDLRALINHGQKLCDALLNACELEVRDPHVSLSRTLGFNHSIAPCLLVVPVEATLMATLPTKIVPGGGIKSHKAFPREATTIAAFEDDVLVLNSLQKPRKLNVRGTDGKVYGMLCKPKDDLRKDQRLMEFNTMINRALKRDTEASKRLLYIKTYAVTPLNEECGAIEWVPGLKPIRNIMYDTYRNRGVKVDYAEMRSFLNAAISDDKEATLKEYWNERLVKRFFPVLHEWFVESFPEPEAWLAARLRYTRSCAVMSMVGHVLGLGDRHGENILLQEEHGGVFHVDFNCLFDKGLTFEKPELVPFRLTHNMVDAMGPYGYEGPYRRSAELTLRVLRAYEDTLMTILETFLHDPTQDFIGKKSRRAAAAGVPETPREVLDSVHGKLRGLMRGESVPLSVEGHVEALVKMAVDDRNLANMYVGWCAFW